MIRVVENGEDGSFLTLDKTEIGTGFREGGVNLQSAGVVEGCLSGFPKTVEAIADIVVDDVGVW